MGQPERSREKRDVGFEPQYVPQENLDSAVVSVRLVLPDSAGSLSVDQRGLERLCRLAGIEELRIDGEETGAVTGEQFSWPVRQPDGTTEICNETYPPSRGRGELHPRGSQHERALL